MRATTEVFGHVEAGRQEHTGLLDVGDAETGDVPRHADHRDHARRHLRIIDPPRVGIDLEESAAVRPEP